MKSDDWCKRIAFALILGYWAATGQLRVALVVACVLVVGDALSQRRQ